jgi:hypothetical protein
MTKTSKPTRTAKDKGKKIDSEDDFEESPSLKPTRNQQPLPTPESKTSSSHQEDVIKETDAQVKSEMSEYVERSLKRKEMDDGLLNLKEISKIVKMVTEKNGIDENCSVKQYNFRIGKLSDMVTALAYTQSDELPKSDP